MQKLTGNLLRLTILEYPRLDVFYVASHYNKNIFNIKH